MATLIGTTTSKKKKVPSKQLPKNTPKKNTKTAKPGLNAKQHRRSPKSDTLTHAATSGAKSPAKSASSCPKHTVHTSTSTPMSNTSSLSTKSSSRLVTSSIQTAARKLKLDDDEDTKSPPSKTRKKKTKIEADEKQKLPSSNSISWLNKSELNIVVLQCVGVSLTDPTLQDKVKHLATEYTPSALKLVYLTIPISSGKDTRCINFDKMGARGVLTKMLVDLIVDISNMKPL